MEITNYGFGEAMSRFVRGSRTESDAYSGTDLGRAEYFLDETDASFSAVGARDVWAWPFPEATTVASELQISGESTAGARTAPLNTCPSKVRWVF